MLRKSLFIGVLSVLSLALSVPVFALQSRPLDGDFVNPVNLAFLPDGSLLVAEASGEIDLYARSADGWLPPKPWADFGEGGRAQLLSFTVDPQFAANGYLYAALQVPADQGLEIQITRWRWAENLVVMNKVLVDHLPSGTDRTGGVLKVGPDGDLWLGLGDGGGSAKDQPLRGTLLRFQKDGSLPPDNPDAKSPIWATGLRDPRGLAWQPDTGRLYLLDRGPVIPDGTMDELDLVDKGADFGWPTYIGREGPRSVSKPVIYCSSGHTWVPGGATFVDSGLWKGSLLFAGAGQGFLYRLSLDDNEPRKILFYDELLNGKLGPLIDVALGPKGHPYVLAHDHVYELTPEDGD